MKSHLEKLIKWDTNCSSCKLFLILTGLGLIYLIFLYPSPEFNSYNKDDASFFLTLGINLAEYGHYTVETFPSDNYGHHATWPPVFPLLLAGIVSLFGLSWVAIKVMMVTLGLTNLYLLHRLLPDKSIGLLVILLTGLSPAYFLFSHVTMTEIPFMLAVTISLLAIERTKNIYTAFAAGLFVGLAFFTRGYAVTLLPAGCLFFILNNQWAIKKRIIIAFSFGLPILIAIVGWSTYTSHIIAIGNIDSITSSFGNGSGFLSKLQMPLEHYITEFYWYHSRFPVHFVLPIFSTEEVLDNDLFAFLGILILMITTWGWFLSIRNRYGIIEIWLPLAIILLLIGSPSARYWITVIPLLLYYFFIALKYISDHFGKLKPAYLIAAIFCVLINIFSLGLHLSDPDKLRFLNSYWHDYQYMAVWVRNNLPKDAKIITHHPHNFFVASNRSSYNILKMTPEDFQTMSCIYMIVSSPKENYKLLEKTTPISEKVIKDGNFHLIRRQEQISLYKDNNSKDCQDSN